jgi:ComF family protein
MGGQYIEPMQPLAARLARRLRPIGQCAVCRGWCRGALCGDCIARHAAIVPRCPRCGLRVAGEVPACAACIAEPPPFVRACCAVDYGFPWDRLIGRFKFGGEVELAGAWAELLLRALPTQERAAVAGVLPIPLAPRRLAERGYNQAWEVARRVATAIRLPADPALLLRPADGPHQASLPLAQRRQNLRHAFVVDPQRRSWMAGRQVAVVDDVVTSGATAAAAAQTLLAAGAAAVQIWALARTPAPEG